MTWEAWVALATVAGVTYGLVRTAVGPDAVLLGALAVLMTVQAVTGTTALPSPGQAVASFGNEGLMAVAALYVVTSGLRRTGAMNMIALPLLGRSSEVRRAQFRMMLPVAAVSAFMNNTPVVAAFMPAVSDWCRKHGVSPSKLFIPLSYAAIIGGTCTLIGTSTNLVVYGMLDDPVRSRIGFFTIGWIGVPATLGVIVYVLLVSGRLLPDRRKEDSLEDEGREYTVEMLVEPGSAVDGKSIVDAGLRNLPGAYLMGIERDGHRLVAVGPERVLRGGDRLSFVGVVDSVVDLQRTRGLLPATDQVLKLTGTDPSRVLVEAVVSPDCPLVGKTIREGRFRTIYNGAIIGVRRNGQNLANVKIGDIVLQAGDALVIEAAPEFIERNRNSRDFFLVSAVDDSQPVRHGKAYMALGILAGMVALVTANVLGMLNAALLAGGMMIVTGCCTAEEARTSIDWRVVVVIGAALGLGLAMEMSGAAGYLAEYMIKTAQGHPWMVLVIMYLVTTIFTELITNNAAAVLMVPIAVSAAQGLGVDIMPFIVVIMVGASASFATPIGYQTNLMVYGPGGYRFSDYLRIGLPLNALVMLITVTMAPLVWAFRP
jgi:di/tricarboxylate transporter